MVKQRTIYLDVVRVVACIMVIVMHAPISGVGAEEHGPFFGIEQLSYHSVCSIVFYGKWSIAPSMQRRNVCHIVFKETLGKDNWSYSVLFFILFG